MLAQIVHLECVMHFIENASEVLLFKLCSLMLNERALKRLICWESLLVFS